MTRSSASIALVTVWDGSPSYACAVLHWCDNARRFSELLLAHGLASRVELFFILAMGIDAPPPAKEATCTKTYCLTSWSTTFGAKRDDAYTGRNSAAPGEDAEREARKIIGLDCPIANVPPVDTRLRRAVSGFVRRGGCREAGTSTMMMKWAATSLERFDLVITSDLDVAVLPTMISDWRRGRGFVPQTDPAVARRWRTLWSHVVPPQRAARVVSSPDYMAPINTGLWTLAAPSAAQYERGLAVLEAATWNASHGWDGVGTPRALVEQAEALGLGWRRRMKRTRWLKHNTWDFFTGDCDQGFLFFMLYLRPSIATSIGAALPPDDDGAAEPRPHFARHYWGDGKPWQLTRGNPARVAYYLATTNFSASTSHCGARFREYATRLGLGPGGAPWPTVPPRHSGKMHRLL